MKELSVLQLFSGVGAQAMALKRAGIPFTSDCCEIDKTAHIVYEALHGPTYNYGDITKVEHFRKHYDLVFWSFPCQSLSLAGSRDGLKQGSGTASSLGWEVIRLIKEAYIRGDAPETLIMENVSGVHDKKNIVDFQQMINELSSMGYTSNYADLDARGYGVPQGRKRCFMVSCKNGTLFHFPKPRPLTKCLADVLEDEETIPDKYYLSEQRIASYKAWEIRQEENHRGFRWNVINMDDPIEREREASPITTIPTRHTQNFIKHEINPGGGVD